MGNPLLAIPFVNVTATGAQESSLVIAQPGMRSGQIGLDDAMALGGLQANALVSFSDFLPGDRWRLNLLGGIGAFALRERFQFVSNSVIGWGRVHCTVK
jgi:hypothetical protein